MHVSVSVHMHTALFSPGSTCTAHQSGLTVLGTCKFKLPIRNGEVCGGMQHSSAWWAQANGSYPMIEACCVRKYEGHPGHYTQQFPKAPNLFNGSETKMLNAKVKSKTAIAIANGRIKIYVSPVPVFRYNRPAVVAVQFLKEHRLLQTGYLAVHWRSEKQHGHDLVWRNATAWTEKVLHGINQTLSKCNLTRVFLAVDFLDFGSQSGAHKGGAQRETLLSTYFAIQTHFNTVVFDPAKNYPAAFAVNNAMAIAAVEMIIMSLSVAFHPLVGAGSFVLQTQQEHTHPQYTLPAVEMVGRDNIRKCYKKKRHM